MNIALKSIILLMRSACPGRASGCRITWIGNAYGGDDRTFQHGDPVNKVFDGTDNWRKKYGGTNG